jgi:enterochelin esterase-like enzyme
MQESPGAVPAISSVELPSRHLERKVRLDFYPPLAGAETLPCLLLINDGQDLLKMPFTSILSSLRATHPLQPLLCVGIHAGEKRKREYGIAGQPDYLGRGDLAEQHAAFVMEEALPYVHEKFSPDGFASYGYAGFSLGALSAFDTAWKHPGIFRTVGVFSGSLWWRSLAQEDPEYDDDVHRLIHQVVREGNHNTGQRFYFQCGNMDETRDRNKNGIIDSVEDTLDLVRELEKKGYALGRDIHYREMVDGRHDVPTWGRALPEFLLWGFGR